MLDEGLHAFFNVMQLLFQMRDGYIQEPGYLFVHLRSTCKCVLLTMVCSVLFLHLARQGVELLQPYHPAIGRLPQRGLHTKAISSNDTGVCLVGLCSAHRIWEKRRITRGFTTLTAKPSLYSCRASLR